VLATDLRDWLQQNPQPDSRRDIAQGLNWPMWQLDRILHYVRTPNFMQTNRWTVPDQRTGRRFWRLSDQQQYLTGAIRQDARRHRVDLAQGLSYLLESFKEQTIILQAELGPNTPAGKTTKAALLQLEAAAATLDQVTSLL
jgi:hypothetical protein